MNSRSKKTRLTSRSSRGPGRDEIVWELLREQRRADKVLVVNGPGGLEEAQWSWLSRGDKAGQAEPAAGSFEQILLRLPRARARLELALHLAAAKLADGGELFLGGMNDEGVKSANRQLCALFEDVSTVVTKRHGRVWRAARPRQDELRSELEQWIEPVAPVGDRPWVSLPGVFAKGAVDAGTSFLLDHLPGLADQHVLDFGAGTGVVAAHLLDKALAKSVVMLETDALAGLMASRNVPEADLILSDGWARLDKTSRFDGIVSNPPIHKGKDEDFSVLRSLIKRAPEYLRPQGRLIFVVQRQVPVLQLFESWPAEVLAENNRFWVIQAVKS